MKWSYFEDTKPIVGYLRYSYENDGIHGTMMHFAAIAASFMMIPSLNQEIKFAMLHPDLSFLLICEFKKMETMSSNCYTDEVQTVMSKMDSPVTRKLCPISVQFIKLLNGKLMKFNPYTIDIDNWSFAQVSDKSYFDKSIERILAVKSPMVSNGSNSLSSQLGSYNSSSITLGSHNETYVTPPPKIQTPNAREQLKAQQSPYVSPVAKKSKARDKTQQVKK